MKKNIFIYVGLGLIIAATILGAFTDVGVASWLELAGFAAGLATCAVSIVKKQEKKDWKMWVALVGVIVGTILLVWAGIAEDTIKSVISAVFGLVVLVTGLLPVLLPKKEK